MSRDGKLVGKLKVSRVEKDRSFADLSPDWDLAEAKDPADAGREVTRVSDLNFGAYVRLLENPERWAKLGLSIDRSVFVQQLEKVRAIRNDVMHFDPDGPAPSDLETLRHFAHFMEELHTIGLT